MILSTLHLLLEYNRDITLDKWGNKLLLANQKDHKRATAENILTHIEQVDPSSNKQNVQWIIKQYVSGALKIEDLYKVTEPLSIFSKYKAKLPVDQRDINKLDIYKLYDITDPILNPTVSEQGTEDKSNKFGEGVKVLYDGPLGSLTIPLTSSAATRLGKGTKWCTTEESMYKYYTRFNPLYIWRDKSGEKYQFSILKNQFRDKSDKTITSDVRNKLMVIPVLRPLLDGSKIQEETENIFKNISDEYLSDEYLDKIDQHCGILYQIIMDESSSEMDTDELAEHVGSMFSSFIDYDECDDDDDVQMLNEVAKLIKDSYLNTKTHNTVNRYIDVNRFPNLMRYIESQRYVVQ